MPRVLVVDDSPDVQELVAVWLLDEGLELHAAADGEQCLARARELRPDLILLDVDLPGADGLTVCRALKADPVTRDAPVVFLSGATSSDTKLAGLDAGAVDYITKPFDPAELRARVRASLRTKHLLDELEKKAVTLRDSEERFRVLAENSSDVIARHAADGAFLYASPACAAILGCDPAAVLGRRLCDFVPHPADRDAIAACFGPVAFRAPTATREYRFRRGDGRDVWLESTFRPVTDPATGAVREVHSSSRDVTARKHAELRELHRSAALELIARDCAPREVVARLIEAGEAAHGGVASVVLLEDGVLTHTAPHLPAALASAIDAGLYRFASRLCSDAAASRDPVITADLATDPRFAHVRAAATDAGLRHACAALIRTGRDDVLGFFAIYHGAADRPCDVPAVSAFIVMASRLIAVSAEHHQLNNRLSYQARHDALTGLPNRALFEDRLRDALARARETGRCAAVAYVDLDRFKQINDTLGHQAGDSLLCQLVYRLRDGLRDADTLARMGGDEFAILFPDLDHPDAAAAALRRIVDSMAVPFDVAGHQIYATLSAGLAAFPRDGRDPVTLQKNADVALYQVKSAGRNAMRCFSPDMSASAMERMEMEAALRAAIAAGDIAVHYQPQVDHAGRPVAVEALARWTHPRFGAVPASVFIPIAEESGLISALDQHVLRQAAAQARRWADAGSPVRVAVNVSATDLARADFADTVAAALAAEGLDPCLLELEITESTLMRGSHDAAARLARLKALGVALAIDDFGTGYSSLAYLQRLRIDTLKIDRSFVANIRSDHPGPRDGAILRAVAAMARALGVTLVAEGVESPAQRRFLHAIDCPLMQGHLFSPPRPADELDLNPPTRTATADAAA